MKRVLKSALFKALFTDGMRRLRINAAAGRIDDQAIAELWLAWDNPEWSATPELLATIGRLALRGASGTILECGSGVSTVVMAAAAHSNGSRVIALESDKSWHRHMTQLTVDLKLSNVEIRLAPLVANGAAD